MSSSGSSSVRVVPSASLEGTQSEGWATSVSGSLHSGIPSPEDARSRRDLEAMKFCHYITSAITEEALESIRECYSIPEGYVLRAPSLEQRPYQPQPSKISISVDALEVGLHFPLYSTIVSGAPTNNKGWEAWYFFVSDPSWRFRADWSIHPISNVPPLLSEEESIAVNRLRGILSLSQAIRNMTERWLVEVRLSPASRGTIDLNMLQNKPRMPGGKGAPAVDPESAKPEVEVTHAGASGKRSVGVRLQSQLPLADPKSRDLGGMRIREDDEGYYVLQMADWAPKDSSQRCGLGG
ncbi:hypothetical protein BHM03_00063035 [Ensete ventricosum]|nr:hypothetical protein BHM03_00063035 [Ensete ventricosum]